MKIVHSSSDEAWKGTLSELGVKEDKLDIHNMDGCRERLIKFFAQDLSDRIRLLSRQCCSLVLLLSFHLTLLVLNRLIMDGDDILLAKLHPVEQSMLLQLELLLLCFEKQPKPSPCSIYLPREQCERAKKTKKV